MKERNSLKLDREEITTTTGTNGIEPRNITITRRVYSSRNVIQMIKMKDPNQENTNKIALCTKKYPRTKK